MTKNSPNQTIEPQELKPRWWAFRLRTLLIGVALLAVPCAWVGMKYRQAWREREVIALIQQAGGFVWYDWTITSHPDPNSGKKESPVEIPMFFSNVQSVHLDGLRNDHSLLGRLGELAYLEQLSLHGDEFTSQELQNLGPLSHLKMLGLRGSPVDDAGLAQLTNLSSLETLQLSETQVTDHGLTSLSKLPRLKSLDLSHTQITDQGIASLSGLAGLEVLNLGRTRLTDASMSEIAKLSRLRELSLGARSSGKWELSGTFIRENSEYSQHPSPISDQGIALLCQHLKQLEFLDLVSTQITDQSLKQLAQLERLKHLRVSYTKVTQQGVAELSRARPDLYVSFHPLR